MGQDKDRVDYPLSTSDDSKTIELTIPLKVAKVMGQAIVFLIAGAIGGGGTTLAIRGVNPPNYDRHTGADADAAAQYSADQRALLRKELYSHLLFSKEKVGEWERRFDVIDKADHQLISSVKECRRNMDRMDGRVTRIEQRMWDGNSHVQAWPEGLYRVNRY